MIKDSKNDTLRFVLDESRRNIAEASSYITRSSKRTASKLHPIVGSKKEWLAETLYSTPFVSIYMYTAIDCWLNSTIMIGDRTIIIGTGGETLFRFGGKMHLLETGAVFKMNKTTVTVESKVERSQFIAIKLI